MIRGAIRNELQETPYRRGPDGPDRAYQYRGRQHLRDGARSAGTRISPVPLSPEPAVLRRGQGDGQGARTDAEAPEGRSLRPGRLDPARPGGRDVVLMRQDPPFDMAYITATHVLEHIHPKTLVVNDPVSVRNAPEKLLVTHFAELMPPTLITADRDRILAFRQKHGEIIVKPLYGNGGAGVFHLRPDDSNLNALLELFSERSREPVIVQRYLPEVRQGDKRIILIDGKPAGAINRVPAKGEARSNMHVGGRAEKSELTARDREICAAIGPTLREKS